MATKTTSSQLTQRVEAAVSLLTRQIIQRPTIHSSIKSGAVGGSCSSGWRDLSTTAPLAYRTFCVNGPQGKAFYDVYLQVNQRVRSSCMSLQYPPTLPLSFQANIIPSCIDKNAAQPIKFTVESKLLQEITALINDFTIPLSTLHGKLPQVLQSFNTPLPCEFLLPPPRSIPQLTTVDI